MSHSFAVVASLIWSAGFLGAQEPPKTQAAHPREATEWIVSYAYNANDAKLPRVLLIGDSICNGYSKDVCEELAGTAYVTFFATSKCVCDKSYLRSLAFFLDEYDYAVIHFNNGLHSLSSDRRDWETCLRASVKLIKAKGKGAKIYWASSTPLKDPALTAKARELNAIAARVMNEEGVPTNDLFALMDPLDREANWSDTFHFKGEAKKRQAKAVGDCVRQALGAGKASEAAAAAALRAAATATGPDGRLDASKK
ncbi:MAG TPA: SGNH/GDSL hydrolase family protein [Kiritimatiellia bacterium]|nr:SGNH/GDSL hydrolase family protein [Kiritimatiellia bacterium]HPS06388.1 SGNH/GDSL hydrolase family protein [Kiritimatiellia bacterium]